MYSILAVRREVHVLGHGNCFYRAMALAVEGKTDLAYPVFRAMCNEMIAMQHIQKCLKLISSALKLLTKI